MIMTEDFQDNGNLSEDVIGEMDEFIHDETNPTCTDEYCGDKHMQMMQPEKTNVIKGAMDKEAAGDKEEIWSTEYSKADMMLTGKIQGMEVKILIDTGSSVTILNDKIFQKLDDKKLAKADLKEIIGIAEAKREIMGTTEICIKCGENELNIRCYVIKNFRYDMVLGLDMLDGILEGIDHRKGIILFKNRQKIEEEKSTGTIECKSTRDYVMKPHSTNIIEIATELPFPAECNVVGNSQCLKKGVLLQRNSKAVNGKEPWENLAQNISGDQVKISKGQNVATAKWSRNIVASAWSTGDQLNQESVTERVASAWSGTSTQLKQEIEENPITVRNTANLKNISLGKI